MKWNELKWKGIKGNKREGRGMNWNERECKENEREWKGMKENERECKGMICLPWNT